MPVRFVLLAVVSLACAPLAWARSDTVLILHTNDVHDHGRVDYDGRGGLPLISSYIAGQRAARPDVLVFDAGDLTEKGDLVATLTEGAATFEAMGMIGFDAGVVGNHETVRGVERLLANVKLARYPFLSVDLETLDGKPLFDRSLVLDADGVRVGVIGIARDTKRSIGMRSVADEEVAERVRAEADALAPEVDLLVVVAHRSSAECAAISRVAPEVDVFVSGHSHETLWRPVIVQETGAIIVQAGSYARLVGRLEVVVDLDANRVTDCEGSMVPMPAAVAPDAALAEWWKAREGELCPEASTTLCTLKDPVAGAELAALFARAALLESAADIALDATDQLRSGLPSGPVDINAVHRAYRPMEAGDAFTLTAPGHRVLGWLETTASAKAPYVFASPGLAHGDARPAGRGRVTPPTIDSEGQYVVVLSGGALEGLGDTSGLGLEPCGFRMVDALIKHLPRLVATPPPAAYQPRTPGR